VILGAKELSKSLRALRIACSSTILLVFKDGELCGRRACIQAGRAFKRDIEKRCQVASLFLRLAVTKLGVELGFQYVHAIAWTNRLSQPRIHTTTPSYSAYIAKLQRPHR
jgi:hypothetical protein